MSSLRSSVASQNFPFVMKSLASASLTTGVSVSGFVAKDGAALTTVAGAITSLGRGVYNFAPTSDDTAGTSLLYLFTGVSMVPVDFTIFTLGYNPTETNVPASVVNHVSVAVSGLVSTALGSDLRTAFTRIDTSVGNVAVGGITETSIATAVWANSTRLLSAPVTIATSGIGNTSFTTSAFTSVAGAIWDAQTSLRTVTGSFGEWFQSVHQATIQSANAVSVVLNTGANSNNDFYNTAILYALAGTGAGQARAVVDYVGSTRTAQVNIPFAVTLGSDTVVQILPNGLDASDPFVTSIGSSYAANTAGRLLTRLDASVGTVAVGGISETSIATAVWANSTRLLSANVTVGAMATEVSVATSGLKHNSLTAAAYASIGAITGGAAPTEASIASTVWNAASRLLTAGVTVAAMATEVSIATSGLRNNAFTAAAYVSIGAAAAAGSVPTEASVASAVWSAATRLLTAGVTVVSFDGNTSAVSKFIKATNNIVQFAVDAGSTVTSIVVASASPGLFVADQLKGRIVIFDTDTATSALRGQASDITSNTTGLLVVTSLTNAPSAGDTGIVV